MKRSAPGRRERTVERVFALLSDAPSSGEGGSRRWIRQGLRSRALLILPVDTRRHAKVACQLYRPYRPRGELLARALRTLAGTGALRIRRTWTHTCTGTPHLESWLADCAGEPEVRLAASIRMERKAETFLVAAVTEQRIGAIARVAFTQVGADKVRREAETYSLLSKLGVMVPATFGVRTFGTFAAHAQQFVYGESSPRRWERQHDRFQDSLRLDSRWDPFVSAITLNERLAAQGMSHLADAPVRAASRLADTALEACVSHGDFAPWNLIASAPERLTGIDWESALLQGIPFLDAFHFGLVTGLLLRGWSMEEGLKYCLEWEPQHPAWRALSQTEREALRMMILAERLAARLESVLRADRLTEIIRRSLLLVMQTTR